MELISPSEELCNLVSSQCSLFWICPLLHIYFCILSKFTFLVLLKSVNSTHGFLCSSNLLNVIEERCRRQSWIELTFHMRSWKIPWQDSVSVADVVVYSWLKSPLSPPAFLLQLSHWRAEAAMWSGFVTTAKACLASWTSPGAITLWSWWKVLLLLQSHLRLVLTKRKNTCSSCEVEPLLIHCDKLLWLYRYFMFDNVII